MIIELLQSDIDAGETCNGFRCAFALALNRQLPGGSWYVNVSGSVSAANDYTKKVARLPDDAVAAIALYDSQGDQGKRLVAPTVFELEMI